MRVVWPAAALVLVVGAGALLVGGLGSPGLADPPEAYSSLDVHVSDEVKAQVGEQIADDLDGLAGSPDGFGDADTVQRYNDLFAAFGDDPAVMAPLYERLGADGMMGTFNGLSSWMQYGSADDGLAQLAEGLRSGLEAATAQPGFDAEGFGEDLVRYATGTYTDDEGEAFFADYPSSGLHAAVLDYLLRDADYSEAFVRGVAWELDAFERTFGTDQVDMWTDHNGDGSPLNALGVEDPALSEDVVAARRPDPMAAAMGQLGEHPGLGLEYFTVDDWRAEHYFGERDWSRDGFAGVTQAGRGVGTDPGNLANAGRDTGMFVSRYFDTLAGNPAFTADNAAAGAEPVADLLNHYMPAVRVAIEAGVSDEPAGVYTTANEFLPQVTHYPKLDTGALDKLLQVGLSTEDGMARIAEGVAHYRNATLAGFSEMYPGPLDVLDSSVADTARTQLANLLVSSVYLDGYMQHAVGEIAIETAGSKAAARDEQAGVALTGRKESLIMTYLALVEAGVVEVPPDLVDMWTPGGDVISLADIDPPQLDNYFGDAANLMHDVVSVNGLLSRYEDPFVG